MEHFVGGFVFGACNVVVGMPLDTLKTLQQAGDAACKKQHTTADLTRRLWREGGMRAFYRGGVPVFAGGGFMRSAQFGFNSLALKRIREYQGGETLPENKLFGCVDPQIVMAGVCGGIGRGLVEAPQDIIKIRRQVVSDWKFSEMLKGSGTTLFRNAFLFSSFVVYVDISKQLTDGQLSPFWTGAICSNISWLTIWPLDVVKSRVQSGRYEGVGSWQLLKEAAKSGAMYRGLGTGLARSFLANGVGMEAYAFTSRWLRANKFVVD